MPSKTFFNLPEKTKNRIIDAVLDEYIENKYEEVTIRTIVKRAEISMGSFYRYFESKEEALLYLLYKIDDKFNKHLETVDVFFIKPNKTDCCEVLSEKENKVMEKFKEFPMEFLEKFYFSKGRKAVEKYNASIFKQSVKRKELRGDIDINLLSFIYSNIMYNLIYYFKENNITDEDEMVSIVRKIYFDYFINGIKNKN